MPDRRAPRDSSREVAALVAELEHAEAFALKLRQIIAEARDQLAAGKTAIALSMLNGALNEIDASADVVARTPGTPRGRSR